MLTDLSPLVQILLQTDLGIDGVNRQECQRIVAGAVESYINDAGAVTTTELVKAIELMVNDQVYQTAGRKVFWAKSRTDWALPRFTSAIRNPYLAKLNYVKIRDAVHSSLQKRSPTTLQKPVWDMGHLSSVTSQQLVYYRDDAGLESYIRRHVIRSAKRYQYRE